ncbi:hypothetical protein ACOMHN_023590 [Nucella lapillus]
MGLYNPPITAIRHYEPDPYLHISREKQREPPRTDGGGHMTLKEIIRYMGQGKLMDTRKARGPLLESLGEILMFWRSKNRAGRRKKRGLSLITDN